MTALELEMVVHFKEMDAESGLWTGTRIRKLCNLLNLTQAEFARFIRLRPYQLEEYIKSEKWPGCLKLVLDLIERSAHRLYLGKHPKRQLFPGNLI